MTRDMPPLLEATERQGGPRPRIAALRPSPAWLVVALIMVGAVTRFYHLGSRSLWLDETYTAQSVRFPTLGDVLTGSPLQPQLLATLDLLDVLRHNAGLGANLLPASGGTGAAPLAERWVLTRGAALSPDHHSFTLTPVGAMVNVTATTRRIIRGTRYVVSFRYRSAGLHGEQRVYVVALAASGQWLDVFPDGAGYRRVPAADWTRGLFAFTAPAGTRSLTVWLRATGRGAPGFTQVALRPVR